MAQQPLAHAVLVGVDGGQKLSTGLFPAQERLCRYGVDRCHALLLSSAVDCAMNIKFL